MEKTHWFHRGVELTLEQLGVLEPLLKQNFGKGFQSYGAFEKEVDSLLAASGCPIDSGLRLPSSMESGHPTNCYLWQIDNKQCVASGFIDAVSLRDAAQQLMLSRHAVLLEKRKVPGDVIEFFSTESSCLQDEAVGSRWHIRLTLMISDAANVRMAPSMLNHKIVPR